MENEGVYKEIGSVIADDVSPSFDVFRFKANANEYVHPGTLAGTTISETKFLLGRISGSIEVNPHESASRAKVREAMGIDADYPEEVLSTNIYRVYEADIIEEGLIHAEGKLEITEPSDMAKAGATVFIPSEIVVAQAMGFEMKPETALCLGRTRITAEVEMAEGETAKPNGQNPDNVLLKPEIVQRHIFIGGTTGSGKSYATGIILEEINKLGLPIVILDSQNEYIGVAEGLGGKVLSPGVDYTVRLSSLAESEVLELVPTLRGTLGLDLLAFTFLRLKREVITAHRESFGLAQLLAEMQNDAPILGLQQNSQRIALQRTQSSLERHKFLGDASNWVDLLKEYPIINVDCGDLDQSQLQLVVGATLRELQHLRTNNEIPPYVAVLDEAHLLVPEGEDSPCKQVIRENVRIGRHYGICMILITQSPVDIDKKTIRQCNTRFIFALEPDQLESIRGVKADATEDMLNRLPKMPRGTCILSGTYETIKHAIPIKIRSDRKTPIGGVAPNIFEEAEKVEEPANSEIRPLTFEETLSRLEAERRLDPAVIRAADYLFAASLLDEERDILEEARKRLLAENPRELYLAFLRDSIRNLKTADRAHQYKFAKQINDVALMGLGIWQEDLKLVSSGQDALRITGEPDWDRIAEHLEQTVFGEYFIQEIGVPADDKLWGIDFPLRMSACDASQHRFKLKIPFNKTWATPIVVNNSGGTIKEQQDAGHKWAHVAVPKDTREYEDWVILGPDDYAEMDEGDYEWAAKSSMDVGEFFVEETFIFKHRGLTSKPDVHFRDGRIYPQDKLMNCKLENRHGQLTREALYRMVTTCRTAEELKLLYCGVAKHVELKVYSTLVNWYVTTQMAKPQWNPTGQILNDSEIMRHLIFHPDFRANTFACLYVTCPILRRFETASNLNRRTRRQVENDLNSLSSVFHARGLSARDIANEALKVGVVMFFAGHTTSDEIYIPRYEFATRSINGVDNLGSKVLQVLSALRLASFDVDEDHLRGLEEPINTLVPTPILVAHDISKKMGEELASNFAQRTTAEFIKRLRERKGA